MLLIHFICLSSISSHRLSPSQTVQFVCANFIGYCIIRWKSVHISFFNEEEY